MRVLLASWAGGGHYAPLVPTGWALRAAGHEVLVACHPSDTGPIVQSGLSALPVGPEFDMFALLRDKREGRSWRPAGADPAPSRLRGHLGMVETCEAVADLIADDLVAFCRRWRPDLVVYEPASLVGPLVARTLGIPAVRQLWTCDFTAPVNGFPATISGGLTERFGLTELDTTGDLTLDPCPAALQVVDDLPRQPVRYVPYNGPARQDPWSRPRSDRRRICVTWGTSLPSLGPGRTSPVPHVVEALADLPVEVIVAVVESQRELFTTLPDNVISLGPVPLHLVLPDCDAVVHQGGGGTLMTAMVNGVPQVIVPTLADQSFNGERVAASGVGLRVGGRDGVPADEIREAVTTVLSTAGHREAALRLRTENADRPSPADIVAILVDLARDGATRPAVAA